MLVLARGGLEHDPLQLRPCRSAQSQGGLEALGAHLAGVQAPAQVVEGCPLVLGNLIGARLQQNQMPGAAQRGGHAQVALALGGVQGLGRDHHRVARLQALEHYAVRREAYMRLDPRTSHDLSFPFNMVKKGWRAVYAPAARAVERPVPSIEGEFRRKRRMMSHAWPTVLGGGMLNPRGYGLTYGLEIFSHRALRYATPFLHVIALAANVVLLGEGRVYLATLAGQLALLAGAALAPLNHRLRLLALCRYYVLMTASLAAGLWDALRHGTPATWEREPERPS